MEFIFIFPNLSFLRLILILSHKSTLSDINPGSRVGFEPFKRTGLF